MGTRTERADERVLWLLRRIASSLGGQGESLVAWDEEDVDAFVEAFPEAKRTLKVYIFGPNSSPLLNRTAKRAQARGLLQAGHIGNQDARFYQQRTWARTWSLTSRARELLRREGRM